MEKTDLYVKKGTSYQISDRRKKKLEPDSKTRQLIHWKIEKKYTCFSRVKRKSSKEEIIKRLFKKNPSPLRN
jgi:hypothetical protein